MAQPGHSHSMSVTQVENQQKSPESDLVKQEKSDSWKVKSSEYVWVLQDPRDRILMHSNDFQGF